MSIYKSFIKVVKPCLNGKNFIVFLILLLFSKNLPSHFKIIPVNVKLKMIGI
ncbi:hypothetical protein CLV48_11425 [Cecembia rubra]|uniref:Uncharacterized protein n=1 Tax=Cecembia rubra TaxID=1485585 RepID=A0A2P8DVG3_9BACT|nr:hypothetical protein CLV48_11425 [Cecembia rubra]